MEGEAAHHLGRVLRAQEGQQYELSDGARVFLARIDPVRARPTNACERRRSDLAADEATVNTPS